MAARGWARLIHPEALTADTLAAQISLALAGPAPTITTSLDGLTRVGRAITDVLNEELQTTLALGRPA